MLPNIAAGQGTPEPEQKLYTKPGAHVPAAKPPELCGRSPQACLQARRAPRLSLPGICMWARPSRQNRHLPIGQERIRAVPKLRAGRYRRHRFAPGCIFKKEAALNLRIHERRCIAKNISGGKYGRVKSIFPVWPLGEKSRPFDPHQQIYPQKHRRQGDPLRGGERSPEAPVSVSTEKFQPETGQTIEKQIKAQKPVSVRFTAAAPVQAYKQKQLQSGSIQLHRQKWHSVGGYEGSGKGNAQPGVRKSITAARQKTARPAESMHQSKTRQQPTQKHGTGGSGFFPYSSTPQRAPYRPP